MIERFEEKRRFPRLNFHTPLRYQILGSSRFDNAISDNVSEEGLSFISDSYMSPNTPVILEFKVLSRMLKAIGMVCWSAPLTHSYRSRQGIKFIEFDRVERDFLSDYINVRLEQA